jgi:hypothetical protein
MCGSACTPNAGKRRNSRNIAPATASGAGVKSCLSGSGATTRMKIHVCGRLCKSLRRRQSLNGERSLNANKWRFATIPLRNVTDTNAPNSYYHYHLIRAHAAAILTPHTTACANLFLIPFGDFTTISVSKLQEQEPRQFSD